MAENNKEQSHTPTTATHSKQPPSFGKLFENGVDRQSLQQFSSRLHNSLDQLQQGNDKKSAVNLITLVDDLFKLLKGTLQATGQKDLHDTVQGMYHQFQQVALSYLRNARQQLENERTKTASRSTSVMPQSGQKPEPNNATQLQQKLAITAAREAGETPQQFVREARSDGVSIQQEAQLHQQNTKAQRQPGQQALATSEQMFDQRKQQHPGSGFTMPEPKSSDKSTSHEPIQEVRPDSLGA